MKKFYSLVILPLALLSMACNAQSQKQPSLDEEVITKTWQSIVSSTVSENFSYFTMDLADKGWQIVDDAADHGEDLYDYQKYYEGIIEKIDDAFYKYIERISETEPYTVAEMKVLDGAEIFAKLIGKPGQTVTVDNGYLEGLFKIMLDNAVCKSVIPVIKSKEFDEEINQYTYYFENFNIPTFVLIREKEDGTQETLIMAEAADGEGCGEEDDDEYWDEFDDDNDEVFDSQEVIAFLKTVYPGSVDAPVPNTDDVTTKRFATYARIELDYVALYQSQEGYAYKTNPNPKFEVYPGFTNTYHVQWTFDSSQKEVILVIVKRDGKYLIDNIMEDYGDEHPLLFDYNRAPVPVYAD